MLYQPSLSKQVLTLRYGTCVRLTYETIELHVEHLQSLLVRLLCEDNVSTRQKDLQGPLKPIAIGQDEIM